VVASGDREAAVKAVEAHLTMAAGNLAAPPARATGSALRPG
jgi:hypothetical protein